MELLSSLPLNVEDHCVVPNWTTMITMLNNSYCTAALSQIPSSRPEGQRSNQSLQINEPRNSPLSSARMKKADEPDDLQSQPRIRAKIFTQESEKPRLSSRSPQLVWTGRRQWAELVWIGRSFVPLRPIKGRDCLSLPSDIHIQIQRQIHTHTSHQKFTNTQTKKRKRKFYELGMVISKRRFQWTKFEEF